MQSATRIMKVTILPIIIVLISTVAANKAFEGVDPNTLSCDPKGQTFLLLPHFSDCSKFFMCAHGEEIEFSCSGGLEFDFVNQVCNWPLPNGCVLREKKEEEDIEGSGEEEFDWLMDKPYKGQGNSVTADNVNSVRPVDVESPIKSPSFNTNLNCLRADSAPRRVSYKGDCQRYWRCANGVPQGVYCSDGLFFNELSQQCDFEANVKCHVEGEDELKGEFIVYK